MRRFSTLFPLLLVCGCFGAKDSTLFNDGGDGIGGATAPSPGGSSNTQAGTDSSSGFPATTGGGSGSGSGSGGSGTAGTSALAAAGGGSDTGSAGAPLGSGGGGGESSVAPVIESCTMVAGAVISELDGHCYRVNEQELSFADARRACDQAGAHLANIGSAEENEWLAALHGGDHWLGATDGRTEMAPGVGTYTWLNGETWAYSDWEDGQPNAVKTACPNEDDGAICYEHCAFQAEEGNWRDRSCWHEIASICEWDLPKPDDDAAGGSGPGDGR